MNDAIVQSWEINSRLNLYLLEAISDGLLDIQLEKGKTVLGQFVHLHNVRRMWVKSAAHDLYDSVPKLDNPSRQVLVDALSLSTQAMTEIFRRAENPEGRVKGFKPHAAGFLGYIVAHEAFHRASVEIALRQAGHSLPDKVAYGLWEWGVR
ncbi:MAG: DinB family protein [Armatimonadota bacterium]